MARALDFSRLFPILIVKLPFLGCPLRQVRGMPEGSLRCGPVGIEVCRDRSGFISQSRSYSNRGKKATGLLEKFQLDYITRGGYLQEGRGPGNGIFTGGYLELFSSVN